MHSEIRDRLSVFLANLTQYKDATSEIVDAAGAFESSNANNYAEPWANSIFVAPARRAAAGPRNL